MPIDNEDLNVIFAYRDGDDDSELLADTYIEQYPTYNIDKLALPCSSNEILNSYSEFQNEVENTIKTFIDASSFACHIIICGYNVPGGFRDGSDVISSTSRLSRINYTFSADKRLYNPLFNRKTFKRYDLEDADIALITSRIDAPTIEDALNILSNSKNLKNQSKANGRFYFDPYAALSDSDADNYYNELMDFYVRTLPLLNMMISSTTFVDPYIDVVLPYLQHDTFSWSWFSDRTDLSFFKETDTARAFLYNADFDGGTTLRSSDEGYWAVLALLSGYVSTAGALSYPGIDGFLIPTPFFYALLNGAILGESFLFSTPYLNWTIGFFGDPLVYFTFPEQETFEEEINETVRWESMSIDLAEAIAAYYKKENDLVLSRDVIVYSSDVGTEVDLLYQSQDLVLANGKAKRQAVFNPVINSFVEYVTDRFGDSVSPLAKTTLTLTDFLANNNYKISRVITDTAVNNLGVPDDYLYDEGYWEFETEILNYNIYKFLFYYFELQVSNLQNFTNIVFSFDTLSDTTNWEYEKEENEFFPLPTNGVTSNYTGRRIRYKSKISEYLPRGETYYFRTRQKIVDISSVSYNNFEQVIYT